jgi:hypothetical protein
MREVIETYRGIDIVKSATVLCDPDIAAQVDEPCEAELDGWRLVGCLQGVKEEIDRKLGPPR